LFFAALMDGWQSAGEHRVVLPEHQLASGVYVARLVADGVAATRKLTFVR